MVCCRWGRLRVLGEEPAGGTVMEEEERGNDGV